MVVASLSTLGWRLSIWAQPASAITVDGDIRLFTVLTALQAGGFQLPSAHSSKTLEVRRQVQASIDAKLSPDLKERLTKFVETHQNVDSSAPPLSKYLSLAMLLDMPPKMGFVWSADKLPPDVLTIIDFQPLVKEFYETTPVERIWSTLQPGLDVLIGSQQEVIMRTIQQTEGYLRLPSYSYLGRHYYIVMDVLGATTSPSARNYGEDYYLIVGPSPQPELDEIRHQFLHFVLDPLSLRVADKFFHKQGLMNLAADNPNLDPQFKKDFMLFAVECLIRATELRLQKLPAAKVENDLTVSAASGFFLIKYFYDQLGEFQKGDQGIRQALGPMVDSIDIEAEKKYVSSLALVTVPTSKPVPTRALTVNEKRLEEAGDLLSQEKYEAAKKIFQEVASTDASLRARAFYGEGVVLSLQRDHDGAKEFFEKALAEKQIDPATRAWSHIYLGRMLDLEGERELAIKQYAAAVESGDDTRNAQAAAKEGLLKPFGGKEKNR
ncbi:MAG: tetratricopeptide repeat protein [Acidobacteriia bacterium]|nr:tetratricopeptide repeat protein [Terriglobia bacterium]